MPTDDKLELLLVEFVNAHFYDGIRNAQGRIPRPAPAEAARAVLLAHIAAKYDRRPSGRMGPYLLAEPAEIEGASDVAPKGGGDA